MDARRSRIALCAALAAAAFATGCGDDGKDDYVKGFKDAEKTFNDGSNSAQAKFQQAKAQRSAQLFVAGVTDFQNAVKEFNGDVEKLDTPDGVEDEEQRVISTLNSFSSTLGRLGDAAVEKDQSAVAQESVKLQSDLGQLRTATDALKKAVE
ncbi:MAG TPA: hypothetical protein VF520_00820 [Thermoleophilaceae bacterium]|jgi:hypothetical protein